MNAPSLDWRPDVLDGFEAAPVADATLVRPLARPERARIAVLHVHGYNDYFFQRHLAEAFTDAGFTFYAVDLARAGRSLRPGDAAHFMLDVAEQGDGIEAAVDAIASETPGVAVVVHAHSTGGLSAAVWASDRPHPSVAALVLDSPLLGLVTPWTRRAAAAIALPLLARRPLTVVAHGPSPYAARLHRNTGGAWDFDTDLKRPAGVPVRVGWMRAYARAVARVRAGLSVPVPVLVARSDAGGPDSPANPHAGRQDTVVDVDAIARLGPRLGRRVEQLVVPGGLHDLSLSDDAPRSFYLSSVIAWIARVTA